jgi:hypothetical protein
MNTRRYYQFTFSILLLLIFLGLQVSDNVFALEIDYGGRIPTPVRTRKPTAIPTATPTITPTPTPTQTIPVLQETTPVPTHIPPGGKGNAEIVGFIAGLFGGVALLIPIVSFWYIKQRKET